MHHFLSPLLSPVWKRLRVVHKRSKYSSQDIRKCIVFKLARFQCLNFPALPIFQTHSWIYLAFVFQFTSLHDYQNMCVCMFVSEIVFFSLHYKCFQKKSWFFSWFLFSPHLDCLVGYCSRPHPPSQCVCKFLVFSFNNTNDYKITARKHC